MMIFTKEKTKQAKTRESIGYRYSVTGVFGYVFFCGSQKLCAVSSMVALSPTIWMDGYGLRWKSDFDQESTIVPGLTRYIHSDSDTSVARVVYRGCGEYEIVGFATVRYDENSYSFFRDGKVIAQIGRYRGETVWLPEAMERNYKPWFVAEWNQELDQESGLLILSFPMLKFGS